jgi:hypothetical protein
MGKVLAEIDDRLRAFLLAQPVFFVATAATSPDQHVNVSPKGMAGSFAVLGPLDHVGDRDLLVQWADRKTDEDLAEYATRKNLRSIDGLPALEGLDLAVGEHPVGAPAGGRATTG